MAPGLITNLLINVREHIENHVSKLLPKAVFRCTLTESRVSKRSSGAFPLGRFVLNVKKALIDEHLCPTLHAAEGPIGCGLSSAFFSSSVITAAPPRGWLSR